MAAIRDLPAELLENILQHLSMKDLLLDQRVCRQWYSLVRQSPRLQRIMFLEFVPAGKLSSAELSRFVLDNTCDPCPFRNEPEAEREPKEKEQMIEKSGSRSPTVKPPTGPVVHINQIFPSEGDVIRMRTMQFRAKLDSRDSWLDMYLAQPPCSQANATVYYKRSSVSGFRIFRRKGSDTATCVVKVVKPDGVRARDVLQAAQACQVGDIKNWQRIDICVPGVVRG